MSTTNLTMENGLAQMMKALDAHGKLLLDMGSRLQELEKLGAERANIEKLDEFDQSFERADAFEKAMNESGNVSSRRSSMDGKSHAQLQHEEYEELRSKGRKAFTIDASEVGKKFQSNLKTVLLTVTAHKGTREDHDEYMDDLETALDISDLDKIYSSSEKEWYEFSLQEENAVAVEVMSKVMIAVFQSSLKKGEAATAYMDYKRERKKDARGMYLAVRDAYHKSSSTLTRIDLNSRLDAMEWGPEAKLGTFYHRFITIVNLIGKLKDADGNLQPMYVPDQVARFQKYFKDSQKDMPAAEQAWRLAFESTSMMCAQTCSELTMNDLKAVISTRLDGGGMEIGGRVSQQTGKATAHGGVPNGKYACHNCGSHDHFLAQCPTPLSCKNCGKTGHTAQICRYKGEPKDKDKGQWERFLKWEKDQAKAEGKSNQQVATEEADAEEEEKEDYAPWHVGVADYVRRQEAAEAEMKQKSKGRKQGKQKAQTGTVFRDTQCEEWDLQGQMDEWNKREEDARKLAFDIGRQKMIEESEAQELAEWDLNFDMI